MATARDLLDAEEQEQARLDLLAEKMRQPAAERIDELLHNPQNRDEELWLSAGVPDTSITIDDYEAVPVDERDLNWAAGLAAMVTAARLQVFAEEREQILEAFKRRLDNVNGLEISNDELQKAAETGISAEQIRRIKKENQLDPEEDESSAEEIAAIAALLALSKDGKKPPDKATAAIDALSAMSNEEFIETLQDASMIPSWNVMQTEALSRAILLLEALEAQLFVTGVSAMIDKASNEGIITLVRRSSSQFTTLIEVNSVDDEFIWVTEFDSSTCDNCRARGGRIMSYGAWRSAGLPGASVCEGGNRCRCDLILLSVIS